MSDGTQWNVAGAMESIACSRCSDEHIITLYIDWNRLDGSHGQRMTRFYPSDEDEIMWTEIFSAQAFDPHLPPPSRIPIVCEVSFRHDDQLRAFLHVLGAGIFELPIRELASAGVVGDQP